MIAKLRGKVCNDMLYRLEISLKSFLHNAVSWCLQKFAAETYWYEFDLIVHLGLKVGKKQVKVHK